MRKLVATIVGGSVALMASVALATHAEPSKAGAFKGELVQAYVACTVSNDVTSNGFPACVPATQEHACKFGPKGKGSLASQNKKTDISLAAKMQGLDDLCDGLTLQIRATPRATADDCTAGAACTVVDLPDFPLASCVVDAVKNSCSIKSSVNTVLPGTILPGKKLGIQLLNVNVGSGGTRVFDTGIFVP